MREVQGDAFLNNISDVTGIISHILSFFAIIIGKFPVFYAIRGTL
jgi:hypothetical protein